MPVERRVPAHRPRYRFHPYVRPAAARHRRWGVVGGSIATITAIAAATTPATTVIPAAAATSAPSVTTMTSMTMVDEDGQGGVSSGMALPPPPPPIQEQQSVAQQTQGAPVPLPDPLIVQLQVPRAVQDTRTVATATNDPAGSTWTVTLQLSVTASRNEADGTLTSQ